MRPIDDNRLAMIDGAKNRDVEKIGLHRFLAALSRRMKELEQLQRLCRWHGVSGRSATTYPKLLTEPDRSQATVVLSLRERQCISQSEKTTFAGFPALYRTNSCPSTP
jgi:hypothetical protein